LNYIDIHTHTYYQQPNTSLVLNVFPEDLEMLHLPALFSIGLHPWYVAGSTWKDQIARVESAATHDNVIAIGETGLDKAVSIPYDIQCSAFETQLEIAESFRKPVVIHCVRSYSEMLFYRKKSNLSIPWIFHWFNSGEQMATELIGKNCYLSFGHLLFKLQSKVFQLFKNLPADRIFLETDDAGYSIQEIYIKAAMIRNMAPEALAIQIQDNFNCCFNRTPWRTG
jgi:TatD DNase family protein